MIRHGLRALASLRLTLVAMPLLAVGVLASQRGMFAASWLALPLGLLALNLLAALATHDRLRRAPGLLVFHVGLLAILLGAGIGLLVRFEGRVEIVEGQAFAPDQVETVARGPWHRSHLDGVAFVQGPVEVDYAPGITRRATRSTVWFPSSDGRRRQELGDNQALHVAGYRFVTTSNKGFAALLTWRDDADDVQTGAVHFPSYPAYDWKQHNEWITPRGETLRLTLLPADDVAEAHAWTLRGAGPGVRLRVQGRGGEAQLSEGESLRLAAGSLRFDGVRLWMGYRVDYNPLLFWLFLAALVAVGGLGWHFHRRLWCGPAHAVAATVDAQAGHGSIARG